MEICQFVVRQQFKLTILIGERDPILGTCNSMCIRFELEFLLDYFDRNCENHE